ncbi:MAG: TIGR03759 family integrating conjugative element protein [Candidatus Competibacteraceae bacterium]
MMRGFLAGVLLGVSCLALVGLAETGVTPVESSPTETSRLSASELERARQWGLTASEWRRYQTLLAGPRGLWSPQLDPLMVLGIHAETEAERTRYADLAAQQEHARLSAELAFQRAYDRAMARRYAGEAVIDSTRLAAASASRVSAWQPGDRLLLFVRPDCTPCATLLARLLPRLRAEPALTLDVYVALTGAADDDALRAWATGQQLPVDLVQARRLTLNHERGLLARLAPTAALPFLARQRAGTWQAVAAADLLGEE